MPEADPTRLNDLKLRWEMDPSSRLFLQLADEHRKLGQVGEAVAVLEKGLAQRPNDLSALVALGRCRLELEQIEEASGLLETVVTRDPTHIVANKLLLEAHLQSGDAEQAAQRLETYRLLNARDPELDHLEYRLEKLGRVEEEEASTAVAVGRPISEETASTSDEVEVPDTLETSGADQASGKQDATDEPEPAPADSAAAAPLAQSAASPIEGDPFHFAGTGSSVPDLEDLWNQPAAADAPAGDPFEGLIRIDPSRHWELLSGEGIFAGPVAPAATDVQPPAAEPITAEAAEAETTEAVAAETDDAQPAGSETDVAEADVAEAVPEKTATGETVTDEADAGSDEALVAEPVSEQADTGAEDEAVAASAAVEVAATEAAESESDAPVAAPEPVEQQVAAAEPAEPVSESEPAPSLDQEEPEESSRWGLAAGVLGTAGAAAAAVLGMDSTEEPAETAAPEPEASEQIAPEPALAEQAIGDAAADEPQDAVADDPEVADSPDGLVAEVAAPEALAPVPADEPVTHETREVASATEPSTVGTESAEAPVATEGESEPVSATLGELYLKQGHHEEAERIFRKVLETEPSNAVALSGLEKLGVGRSRPLSAADLLAVRSTSGKIPEGLTAKKVLVLSNYVKHIRAGQHVH